MKKIISHRGNVNGSNKKRENRISSIVECLNLGFDVEIDVFLINQKLYLGHDEPQEEILPNFLDEHKKNLWIHCKNFDSLNFMTNTNLNYFWHENDKFTLTSYKFVWTYPNNIVSNNSVIVCSSIKETNFYKNSNSYGICTDWIEI